MGFFTNYYGFDTNYAPSAMASLTQFTPTRQLSDIHSPRLNLGRLVLLIFEASMEVVCVSLPGYILARKGMFSAENQKFVANLNVALFTPCLIFTKIASKLTADKLLDLAIIPAVFAVQTILSYLVSILVAKAFGFNKKPANFVTAMGVFGNSNSLPISLVISLSQTLKGLHWSKIPNDNNDEVAARGILYILIFQQLGQLLRWSWGYHVLLAPDKIIDPEQGNTGELYADNPHLISGLDNRHVNFQTSQTVRSSSTTSSVKSDKKSVKTKATCTKISDLEDEYTLPSVYPEVTEREASSTNSDIPNIVSFPSIRTPSNSEEHDIPSGFRGIVPSLRLHIQRLTRRIKQSIKSSSRTLYTSLPCSTQIFLSKINTFVKRFLAGVWEFMNPPLWAMLCAIIVASVPALQYVFFTKGSFIANSFTRAVSQSGGVAIPLILVVLGANLARNTLPQELLDENSEENKIRKKLIAASLLSRMVFPVLIMTPLLALTAKYVPVSIVDDPIFVVVCFLLTGAPSALQLAQICQINGVYQVVMSKLLFHSYVVWIFPSTLVLVTLALEVVRWASASE